MSSNPDSVVLEEEIDQNYEPTQEEIIEYATWLGMVRRARSLPHAAAAVAAVTLPALPE